MNLRVNGLKRVISTIIALTIMVAPIAAFPAHNVSEEKSTSKPSEPLKDSENPLMIGKRDINKRSIDFYSLSEFNLVKQKLLAIINQNSLADTGKAAPTLKRKPSRGNSNGNEDESEKAPPTLKRKPGSAPDND